MGTLYERDVAFLGHEADSLVAAPFVFSASVQQSHVLRGVRSWLLRDGSWDPYHQTEWQSDPTRTPWRILPHGPVGLIVGLEDALEGIVFDEGPRQLDLRLGTGPDPWSGPLGESVSLRDGELEISGVAIPGMVLELSRTWQSAEYPPGDWFFLASGDSLGIVLLDAGPPGAEPRYRGWARTPAGDVQWPEIDVDPAETRPFEPARREVPSRWILRSAPAGDDDSTDFTADVVTVSWQLRAESGDGPLLPVAGILRVRGQVSIGGQPPVAVEGLVRHRQG